MKFKISAAKLTFSFSLWYGRQIEFYSDWAVGFS